MPATPGRGPTTAPWLSIDQLASRGEGFDAGPPAGRSGRRRSAAGRAEPNGQLVEAAEHEPVTVGPVKVTAIDGQREIGEASDQRAEGDPSLEPGQRCP